MSDSPRENTKSIYLLHGEENFLINRKFKQLERQSIEPGFEEFNKFVFYGLDANATHLMDQATTYPMMGGRQLIVLKNAHQFKNWDQLLPYAKNPSDFSTFLIVHPEKKIDGRTAFVKALKDLVKRGKAEIYEAKKLYDNKVPGWISEEVSSLGFTIQPRTAAMLGEYLGNNLEGILKEVDKIILNLEEGQKEITLDHVNKFVGVSRKFSVFELQKAMAYGEVDKAATIANLMSQDPKTNPIYMLTGALFNFFSRVYKVHALKSKRDADVAKALKLGHAFFAKEYLSAVRYFSREKCEEVFAILYEFDLRSKGIDSPTEKEDRLLRAMVAQILTKID
nr:DNA polymerase III subunit delta [Saprospiraceae bacterium]